MAGGGAKPDMAAALFMAPESRARFLRMARENREEFVSTMSALMRTGNKSLRSAILEIMSKPDGRSAIEGVMRDTKNRAREEMRQMIRKNNSKATPEILAQYNERLLKLLNGAKEYANSLGGNFKDLYQELKHEYDLNIFSIWVKVRDQLKTPLDRSLDLSRDLERAKSEVRRFQDLVRKMTSEPTPELSAEQREGMLTRSMNLLDSEQKRVERIEAELLRVAQEIGPDEQPRFNTNETLNAEANGGRAGGGK